MIDNTKLLSLRRVAQITNGGTPGNSDEFWNGEIPWATPVDLGKVNGKIISQTGRHITESGLISGSTLAPKNSILISCRAPIGYVAINQIPMAFNQGCKAIIPRDDSTDTRFLKYALESSTDSIRALGQGSTFLEVSSSQVSSISVPWAQSTEQRQIADYLDHETAEIDAFITEQLTAQRLLRERRSAVITRAVTKGLDPSAKLVESGDEAIGTYPAHWRLMRVKHLGESIIGLTYSPEDIVESANEGTLVVRAGNIQDGRLQPTDPIFVSSKIPEKLRLRCGDIVICARNGSANLVGKNAPVSGDFLGSTWGAFMVVVRSTYPKYLRWFLNSEVFSAQTGSFTTTTINQLTSSNLGNLVVALPPASEQESIDTHLRKQTARIDEMSQDLRRLIDLARERRAALITAAVTGQIDVTAKNKPAAEQLEDDIAQGLHKES